MTQMHRSCKFQNLNWKNLSTQRDMHKALMVFKSLNGLTPDNLSSKFIALYNTTSYTCRDSANELTLFLNTMKYQVSFIFSCQNITFCLMAT